MAGETLKDEWRALDHRTRWRLRRVAWKGTVSDDPREAELVTYFAREQLRRYPAQIVLHVVVIAGVTASLLLNLSRGGNGLAVVYAGLLVFDSVVLGFTLRWHRCLQRAAQQNERMPPEASHATSGPDRAG